MHQPTHQTPLAQALAMHVDGDVVHADVEPTLDVFGIPHGGYLAAMQAGAVLEVSDAPDIFTITVHYLRKAQPGPIELRPTRLGGSRRFSTWQVAATQDGEVVLAALVSVGDRSQISGPTWTDAAPWDVDAARLSPPAGDPALPFLAPRVAQRFGLRLDLATTDFAAGRTADHAHMRGVMATTEVDQLTALLACDVTPPAPWNVLGSRGWVPTVELTAHVRARPAAGPLRVDVATHHVADGFLEEDALVHDSEGTLVVQSRQLARWTQSGA